LANVVRKIGNCAQFKPEVSAIVFEEVYWFCRTDTVVDCDVLKEDGSTVSGVSEELLKDLLPDIGLPGPILGQLLDQ
jgi:hypothetical protein